MADATTIVFHLGAPSPNMDVLTSSLRKDNILLSEHHMMARRPRHYRGNVHNRLMEIEIDGEPSEATETFLAKLCQQQEIKRLLLSDGSFLGPLEKIVSTNGLYASAEDQIRKSQGYSRKTHVSFSLRLEIPVRSFGKLQVSLKKMSMTS